MNQIKLFVGLGNPGEKYSDTRHNAGFWWIDLVAHHHNIKLQNSDKFSSGIGKLSNADEIYFAKPSTYMNDSGKALAAISKFYKINPNEILVIHDDLDIDVGQAKLKFGGSHGGHNGLKSIFACIGSQDFWRLKIGIGHPGEKHLVVDYVLKNPSSKERNLIDESIEASSKLFNEIASGQFEKAMLNLHTNK
ncbi:aminoacyl-tRNA hydrolase [Candidatus Methylopumilus universalis]|uniref:aminoacyl-tRNA hydrolase n=1 Tax=Candidatus Methylopumilus universalis TaxID=2588536 RepID=UPI001122B91B|nr:aminoacyl-tRNA hydrolase [Candidatus Methylopumilus universalis]QDC80511.1 aminoacyl-tRNA hydrolase [Candidatus Methylopumilus universalis]QDC81812.1 aminoacyl-tRNA hydrolase [Candidatus Methylopumilus universalis]QDC88255.1 aminoacyl-tRNA hydrolase [Candidatus Methylopumilus universalis]